MTRPASQRLLTEANAAAYAANPATPLGAIIAANATLTFGTEERPDPATLPPGMRGYDMTLAIPLWSDGAIWRDATGAPA